MSQFVNQRTVESFKAENKTAKLFFNIARKKDGSYPTHRDGTKMVAVSDEAGNTVAWCSSAVCKDLINKVDITKKALAFVDVIADNGQQYTTLVYPGQGGERLAVSL